MMKQKTGIEILLWVLFLLVCGTIGYFQGLNPDGRLVDYLSKPTPVRIFTISRQFFPDDVIAQLEKETHSKISVTLITNWDDLNLKLIASNAPDILFVPSHWAQTLHQEVLLNADVNFKNLSEEDLSNDFKFDQSNLEQDFLPAYWAQLALYSLKDKKIDKIKKLSFLGDADLFLELMEDLKKNQQDNDFAKYELTVLPYEKWLTETSPTADLFLATHVNALGHPNWKIANEYPPFIYVLGFALPKNSENPTKALNILKNYLDLETQRELSPQMPFASTLSVINRLALGEKERKASYLRDLVMRNTLFVKTKEKNSEQKASEYSGAFKN
jgi:hypothetical protein